jgi:5-formyltetrahydrofolate cyclo-ligase
VNSQELKRAKGEVRRRVIAARDAMSAAERAAGAQRVADRFLALPEVAAARTVMAFSSFGSELPMDALIAHLCDAGVTVGLPKIVEGALEVRSFRPGDPTTRAAFGALEPATGNLIPPATIDVIVTPAVAFDRTGRRIGYGGGFYDRFFTQAGASALRVGVGATLQVLHEDLPSGHFDLRVDVIVTPDETIRCRA